jgi:uncharacterized protein (TIGR02646 family)
MIRVDRNKEAPPDVLTHPRSKGVLETARALKHFGPNAKRGRKTRRKFKFEAYRSDEVKLALNKLFQAKCAYCESRYAAVQPMDVEHWRPKSLYYWLAANWDNLLPSCIDCNRQRNQFDEREKKGQLSGKGTEFPLADLNQRWSYHGLPCSEVPLLLNPCADWPEKHLDFFDEDEALVRPRRGSRKGRQSLRVFGLNRSGLVLERKERLLRLKASLFTLNKLAEILNGCRPVHRPIIETLLDREVEFLERSLQDCQPYAQMARQIVGPSKKFWMRSLG